MQRRAAAVYVAILGAIAIGSAYAVATGRAGDFVSHFWAVGFMSGFTAVLLLAMAYMPVRGD